MTLIWTVSPDPITYAELVKTLFSQLPKGYWRLDIVTNTYRYIFLENNERDSRGVLSKVIICSASSKIQALSAKRSIKKCLKSIWIVFEVIRKVCVSFMWRKTQIGRWVQIQEVWKGVSNIITFALPKIAVSTFETS